MKGRVNEQVTKRPELPTPQGVGRLHIQNGHGTDSEQLTTNGTQFVVTTLEVVHLSLRLHGVVLQFRLSQHWGVSSNDNQLGLSGSQGLDNRLVTQGVFTGFDHQTQLGVDVFLVLRFRGLH